MSKRITARELVRRELGENHLGRRRLQRAIFCFHMDGWQLAYRPSSDDPDRIVVAVRRDHPLADLLGVTYDATCEQPFGTASLPRHWLEGQIGCPLSEREGGAALARFGLTLMACDDDDVALTATNPELARVINSARYGDNRKGFHPHRLTQAALGMPRRPRRLYESSRLRAGERLEQFGVDATGLCDRSGYVHLKSNWVMSERVSAQTG
jgi:hypothetical protein